MGKLWLLAIIIAFAFDALIAWALQALWNWLLPGICNAPEITYWQAFGVMLLLSIVGSFFKSSK